MKGNQIFDKGRGSAAELTGRVVDGEQIWSKRIRKNDSKTLKQTFQRDKKAFVGLVAQSVQLDIIDNFWPKPRPLVSGYNDFESKNLISQTTFVDEGTPFAPDKLALITSKGSLEGAAFIGGNSYKTSDGAVNVAWDDSPKASGEATDKAVIVVYDISTNFPYIDTTAQRQDGGSGFNISSGLVLANLVFILFMWREGTKKQLRSSSLTIAPIAG